MIKLSLCSRAAQRDHFHHLVPALCSGTKVKPLWGARFARANAPDYTKVSSDVAASALVKTALRLLEVGALYFGVIPLIPISREHGGICCGRSEEKGYPRISVPSASSAFYFSKTR